MPRKAPTETDRLGYGSIRADEVLPLREAARRLGWERKTIAHAQRAGLVTVQFGRFKYVTGRSVVEFMEKLAAEPSIVNLMEEAEHDSGN